MVLVLATALAAPALAGRLELELSCQASMREGGLEVGVTVSNRGDEAAASLQAVPLHPPGAAPSPVLASLAGGERATLPLSWGLSPGPPGGRCAVLRLDLRDQEQMPLSAMGYACYDRQDGWEAPLTVQAPPLELTAPARLAARLGNAGPLPLKVTVRVFAPRELEVPAQPQELIIPAGQSREVSWPISNQSGQAQARYPVLIHSALDLEGRHGERVDEVMITLAAAPNPFRDNLGWWLAALAGLGLWVGLAQWRARRP